MPISLKLALRHLRRSSGFTLLAISILALGIGATTAMFTIVNTALWKPLPYRDPEQLITILFKVPSFSKQLTTVPVNAQHFQLWRDHAHTLTDVAIMGPTSAILSGVGEAQTVTGVRVSANLFHLLGVTPKLGRSFAAHEDEPGRNHVVILSHDFWRESLGGRADILGQKILLNGESYQVIGIMPAGLLFPRAAELSDVLQFPERSQYWTPLVFSKDDLSAPLGFMDYAAIARMRPGTAVPQVTAELTALERVISKRFPQRIELDPMIHPLQQLIARRARLPLIILMAAVGAVLLIICINVMNLMLVRAISRRREWSIELAVGARVTDIITSALSESVLLAIPAAGLGILLAGWLLTLVRVKGPAGLPRISNLSLDGTALLFSIVISLASAILFGLWPAWRASRSDPQTALQSSGRSATEGRRGQSMGRLLVAAEVALSTVLLLSACLLLRSFATLLDVNPGVSVRNLVTARVNAPVNNYKTDAALDSFYRRVTDKVSRLPGVEVAGVVSTLPVTPEDNNNPVSAGDRAAPPLPQWQMAHIHAASPDYFKAAGIPTRQGSIFSRRNGGAAGVIISDTLASRLWPGKSAVGRTLRFYSGAKATVTGVVGAVQASSLAEQPGVTVYIPVWIQSDADMSLVVRTATDANLAPVIRRAIRQIDPQAAVPTIQTMREIIQDSVAPERFQLYLLIAFAIAALVLASLGIYGVLSFATARRTTEIGVRMALGAQPMQVLTATLQSGLAPVLIGVIVGLGASVALSRILQSLLFDVKALDPLAYGVTALLLLIVAGFACAIPARRAAKLSPVEALRYE